MWSLFATQHPLQEPSGYNTITLGREKQSYRCAAASLHQYQQMLVRILTRLLNSESTSSPSNMSCSSQEITTHRAWEHGPLAWAAIHIQFNGNTQSRDRHAHWLDNVATVPAKTSRNKHAGQRQAGTSWRVVFHCLVSVALCNPCICILVHSPPCVHVGAVCCVCMYAHISSTPLS